MNFIEELYYGNINPNEKKFCRDTQYAKAMETFCKGEKTLGEMLKGDMLYGSSFNFVKSYSTQIPV